MNIVPTITFTIPSLHDQVELECRIYHPSGDAITEVPHLTERNAEADGGEQEDSGGVDRILGAVLAHPYARLGGCFDDPAIIAVTAELLQHNFVVGTFNFRGAGGSKGSTSWTGFSEVTDYVSFMGFFVCYLDQLQKQPVQISLLLGGYSYGSRILIHIPSISSIIDVFASPPPGSTAAVIAQSAVGLARKPLKRPQRGKVHDKSDRDDLSHESYHCVVVGGTEVGSPQKPKHRLGIDPLMLTHKRTRSSETQSKPVLESTADILGESKPDVQTPFSGRINTRFGNIDVRFLLISPVLPPLAWAISPGLHRPTAKSEGLYASTTTTTNGTIETMELAGIKFPVIDNWWQYPSLVLYGDGDHFTAARKIQGWAAGLTTSRNSKPVLTSVEVENQGHFWHSLRSEQRLRSAIRTWLAQNTNGQLLPLPHKALTGI